MRHTEKLQNESYTLIIFQDKELLNGSRLGKHLVNFSNLLPQKVVIT